MKRHAAVPESALEAGRALGGAAFGGGTLIGGAPLTAGGGSSGSSSGSKGNVSMVVPPNIQPYQASGRSGGASSHKHSRDRDGWQQVLPWGVAVWVIGCLMGYSMLWPINLAVQILSGLLPYTPFGGLLDWFGAGAPMPVIYPAANELKLPGSQVARYADSYLQNYGDAALVYAANDGYPQLVSALLLTKDSGFLELIDAADQSGTTALLYAAGRGFSQVAAVLLRAGADPNAPRQGKEGRGLTPLMEAAGTGHREIVTLLLQANATIDLRDEQGNTALMYAAQAGNLGTLQELLHHGAVPDFVNKRGQTAMSFAAGGGNQAVIDALQRGARPVVDKLSRKSRFDQQGRRAIPPENPSSRSDKTEAKAGGELDDVGDDNKEESESQGLFKDLMHSVTAGRAAAPAPNPKESKNLRKKDAEAKEEEETRRVISKAEERSLKLEEQLAQLKRDHEATDLKSQRRIVELLEQSTDKQKQLDDMQRQLEEARTRADDLSQKLRDGEERSLQDELRHSELSKEAHELRMQLEGERSKTESAMREKDRQVQDAKRSQETLRRVEVDLKDRDAQVERLKRQMDTLRSEANRAEEERREAQRQLELLHSSAHSAGASSISSMRGSQAELLDSSLRKEEAALPPQANTSAVSAASPSEPSGHSHGGGEASMTAPLPDEHPAPKSDNLSPKNDDLSQS